MSPYLKKAFAFLLILLITVQGASVFFSSSEAKESFDREVVSDTISKQLPTTFYLIEQGNQVFLLKDLKSFANNDLHHFLPPALLKIPSVYKSTLGLWKYVDVSYGIREIIYPFHFFW